MVDDVRPEAATGHLFLKASDVRKASERLESVGVRAIVRKDQIAILELRGGTHIVVRPLEDESLHEAPFDLMFDDIDAAHTRFGEAGFEVTGIEDGRIHRSFQATAPERFRVQVLDSHAGKRAV